MNVDEIKQQYPNPVIYEEGSFRFNKPYSPEHGYCVGGAFCLAMGENNAFPGVSDLAYALMAANPRLPSDRAIDYADAITEHNDHGQFVAAWKALKLALEYTS